MEGSVVNTENTSTISDSLKMRKSLRGVGKNILNTSPPKIGTTWSRDVRKFSGKAITINLGVGNQVNQPANIILIKLVNKPFLPEILPATQHREGMSKGFYDSWHNDSWFNESWLNDS